MVDPADRAGWLLNLTNDGWFGISTGPHQHFAAARFRAVEEGLPLVRAANTGISAIVDGWGRIVERTSLGEMAVLDGALPVALSPTPMRAGETCRLLLLFCSHWGWPGPAPGRARHDGMIAGQPDPLTGY